MADRRRMNGPVGGTLPPVFAPEDAILSKDVKGRTRPSDTARPLCEFFYPLLSSWALSNQTYSSQDWNYTFSLGLCLPRNSNISKTWR